MIGLSCINSAGGKETLIKVSPVVGKAALIYRQFPPLLLLPRENLIQNKLEQNCRNISRLSAAKNVSTKFALTDLRDNF